MLVHIMDQPELREGEGPIAVIMAPTRELAEQIHREARRFAKGYGLRICAAFGGLEKRNQVNDLKAGSEVRGSCMNCVCLNSVCASPHHESVPKPSSIRLRPKYAGSASKLSLVVDHNGRWLCVRRDA